MNFVRNGEIPRHPQKLIGFAIFKHDPRSFPNACDFVKILTQISD